MSTVNGNKPAQNFETMTKQNQIELLYEASKVNDVLLSALKLSYERAAQVGYLNAGLSTDELILVEKAIKSADPNYRYKGMPTVMETHG